MAFGKARLAPQSKKAIEGLAKRAARSSTLLGAILEERVERLGREGQAGWPILTGRSRGGIETGLTGTATAIRAFIKNDVPYSGFVRIGGSGQNAWAALIVGPAENVAIDGVATEFEELLIGD